MLKLWWLWSLWFLQIHSVCANLHWWPWPTRSWWCRTSLWGRAPDWRYCTRWFSWTIQTGQMWGCRSSFCLWWMWKIRPSIIFWTWGPDWPLVGFIFLSWWGNMSVFGIIDSLLSQFIFLLGPRWLPSWLLFFYLPTKEFWYLMFSAKWLENQAPRLQNCSRSTKLSKTF